MNQQQILAVLALIANQQITIEQLLSQINQLSTELQELKAATEEQPQVNPDDLGFNSEQS